MHTLCLVLCGVQFAEMKFLFLTAVSACYHLAGKDLI